MTKTSVTFLLDKSGSMNTIKDDTIGAFNAYLDGFGEGEGIDFTFVQFDSISIDKTCVRQPIKDVARLTNETYQPRGWTPLIDAAYKTIKAVEDSLTSTKLDVDDDQTKVVICIHTDGQENASTEYTWDQLNALIKEKTAAGWQFNFMGAGIDAYEQGIRMGIPAANTMSYDSYDRRATFAAFASNAQNTVSFSASMSRDTAYSGAQKIAAGDKFDPALKQKKAKKTKIVDDITL